MPSPLGSHARQLVLAAFAVAAIAACGTSSTSSFDAGQGAASASLSAAPPADAAAAFGDAEADASEDAGDDAGEDAGGDAGSDDGGLPGSHEGCPDDMVLVAGNYCPSVDQVCLEYHEEYKRDEAQKKAQREGGGDAAESTVSERCLKYKEPTECLSKTRTPMRFCMDRYEWPNKKGELPMFLISWRDAKKECEKIGKRLCGEDEFNLACEGEAMLPYTYGYERDPTKCNIDKAYRKREKRLIKYAACMKKPKCKAELARLDQRLPAGSMPQCVSPFGVYDLNGNINEWVVRPRQKPPSRSGLKGGWWGPVRGRCRPTVGFHKEEDYGYEEGFRCCKDAAAP
jgi:sulfatase modifying factor 1